MAKNHVVLKTILVGIKALEISVAVFTVGFPRKNLSLTANYTFLLVARTIRRDATVLL